MVDKICSCKCQCGNVSRFMLCPDCQISIHYDKNSGKMKRIGFVPISEGFRK